jgi:hypothetical protein
MFNVEWIHTILFVLSSPRMPIRSVSLYRLRVHVAFLLQYKQWVVGSSHVLLVFKGEIVETIRFETVSTFTLSFLQRETARQGKYYIKYELISIICFSG